jgi:hypothetical protein
VIWYCRSNDGSLNGDARCVEGNLVFNQDGYGIEPYANRQSPTLERKSPSQHEGPGAVCQIVIFNRALTEKRSSEFLFWVEPIKHVHLQVYHGEGGHWGRGAGVTKR